MFDQLDDLVQKFEDIGEMISDPMVIADQERWQKLMKEHSDLRPIVEKYIEYKDTLAAIDDALMMLEEKLDDDFRELVKDLAAVFRTRIELRQIGVRDETKMQGGIGICGRNLCCNKFLSDFQPVSIKMAKDQSLSLNPIKISGICGRLMCCLKYEEDVYVEIRGRLPEVGDFVQTPDGRGEVLSVNVLREQVKAAVKRKDKDEKEAITYSLSDIKILTRKKKSCGGCGSNNGCSSGCGSGGCCSSSEDKEFENFDFSKLE